MKATFLTETQKPFVFAEIPVPEPEADEVLVQIKCCGICHTDVSIYEGSYPPRKSLPLILGHEFSGIVKATGSKVEGLSEGDRVVVYNLNTCGQCVNCRSGRENLCLSLMTVGIDCDGAFREYMAVPARNCFSLPESISFAEGAVITDAISTPFHAVTRSGIEMGQTVVIFGSGALGLNAIQIVSKLRGARIIAVDLFDEKLELAKDFGAHETINARNEDVLKRIKELTGNRGADCALEFVGHPVTYDQAIQSVRPGGKVVIVGATRQEFMVNPVRLFKEEVSVTGSYGYVRDDLANVLQLVASGQLNAQKSVTHQLPLTQINEAFAIACDKSIHSLRVVISMETCL